MNSSSPWSTTMNQLHSMTCKTGVMTRVRTTFFCLLPPIRATSEKLATLCANGIRVKNALVSEFFVNFPAERIISPNTLILFQLLDFNHQALLFKDTTIYDVENFYRIAWGYLRPIGVSKNHVGTTKIQLYQYKFDTKRDFNLKKKHIPNVYYDFLWNNH